MTWKAQERASLTHISNRGGGKEREGRDIFWSKGNLRGKQKVEKRNVGGLKRT